MVWYNRPENEWTVSLLDIQPDDRVLEIGFGPGLGIQYASKLATRGFVVGLDHSETVLMEATRRNASAIEIGQVELKRGDVADIPYPAEFFDKAFAVNAIYFGEPVAALKEIHRVLRPGGIVAITVRQKNKGVYLKYT